MAQPAAVPAAPPPLWRNASFHILWTVTFASGVGDRLIMSAALEMLGYASEGVENARIQAGINFFFFLPYLLWSPMAGWLADRLPRKWLMFASDELRGLIVLYAFTLLPPGLRVVPLEEQWQVWALIGAVGVMAATFVPAKLSSVPNVVGMELVGRANAMVISMGIVGNLIGFLVGGWIVDYSLSVMILTSSLCYAVSGLFWIFLKMPYRHGSTGGGGSAAAAGSWPNVLLGTGGLAAVIVSWAAPAPTWMRVVTTACGLAAAGFGYRHILREIGQGVRYAWTHKPVRVLLLINAVVWGGVAVYQPALAVVNVELYGGGTSELQFVMAPIGLGMLLASAAFGAMNPRLGNEILIVVGLVLCGVFIGLQMVVPVFGLGVAIALMTGLGAGTIFVPLYTILQRATADHIRGRVFGAKEIVGEFGQVVVSFLIWRTPHADVVMRPATGVLAIGLVALAAGGLWRYVLTGPTPSRVLNLCWRLVRLYTDAVHRLKIVGRHRVPRRGPVLLVSNHTSGLDPALIQACVPRMIRWMMAREYMLPGLGWFWRRYRPIPVDRMAADPGAAKAAVERLRNGEVVGIFPEGRINHGGDGLLPLGPGAALIARRTDALVVPVHITGTPRRAGPLISYLIPSRSRVIFGRPFRLTGEDAADRERAVEVIRQRMEHVQAPSADGPSPAAR